MSTVTATPKPANALVAQRIDFPTWLPAMLVKELRQGLRTKGFVGALVGFQVIMTLVTVFAIAGGSDSSTYEMLQISYWMVLVAQLLLITPARAMAGLQSELESRSIDLLLLTRLTAWRVVLGKWCSLLVQAALLVVAMLPYGVARYFFGSVDLTGELKLIGALFGLSGVFTAAALWSSALPKFVRAVLGIALLFSLQFTGLFGPRSPFAGGPAGFAGIIRGSLWLVLFDVALVLALCLLGAVARLSPAAESKAGQLRALPLIALLPLPFLGLGGGAQFVLAMLLFGFVAIMELARAEEPMSCHWRPWLGRGRWGRFVGRFVQPGWASAMEWVCAFALLMGGAGMFLDEPLKLLHLGVLAAAGLVFPALLLTWMSSQFTQRIAGYILLLGGASTLAAVSAATASFTKVNAYAEASLLLMPIAGFWTTAGAVRSPAPPLLVAQVAIALAVLGVAWWRAAPYRMQRRLIESDREAVAE